LAGIFSGNTGRTVTVDNQLWHWKSDSTTVGATFACDYRRFYNGSGQLANILGR
jgi:hypothetical protein